MIPINLAIQTFDEFNKSGADNLLLYTFQTVPSAIYWLFAIVYFVVVMGTYYASVRMNGRADFLGSLAVGAFIANVFGVLLSLKPGLVPSSMFAINLTILFVSVVLLFFTKERY